MPDALPRACEDTDRAFDARIGSRHASGGLGRDRAASTPWPPPPAGAEEVAMIRRVRVALVAVAVLALATGAPVASAADSTSAGVAIVSHTGSKGAFGLLHIVGEVVNNGRLPVRFVNLKADLFDAGGTKVGSTLPSYTALDVIDPGDTSPFHVLGINSAAVSYQLWIGWSSAPKPSNDYFTVTATSVSSDTSGHVHVAGTIRNDNTTTAPKVRVDATLYDADGKVVDTEHTASDQTVETGQTAPFEVTFSRANTYASYRLLGHSDSDPALAVTLAASPTSVVYGTLMRLTGRAAPGAVVTIPRWAVPTGWVGLAQATADGTGAFSVDAKITTTWFVRALTDSGPSVPLTQAQKALVSMKSNVSTVHRGAVVTLSGLVRPMYPGQKVAIEQYLNWTWKTIGYATLSSASTYTFTWTARTNGTFSFRASMTAQADSLANVSATRRIVVK